MKKKVILHLKIRPAEKDQEYCNILEKYKT